jgi:hypothetical protein
MTTDEEILKKLHPKVPWSDLSKSIKELMKEARADERAKIRNAANPTEALPCFKCGTSCCAEEITCTPCRIFANDRTKKEAKQRGYERGQADLIEKIEPWLAKENNIWHRMLKIAEICKKASESLGASISTSPSNQKHLEPKPEKPKKVKP